MCRLQGLQSAKCSYSVEKEKRKEATSRRFLFDWGAAKGALSCRVKLSKRGIHSTLVRRPVEWNYQKCKTTLHSFVTL